jgi:hypothetical protein
LLRGLRCRLSIVAKLAKHLRGVFIFNAQLYCGVYGIVIGHD